MKHLYSLIVWCIVFLGVAFIVKFLGGGELLQGSLGAIFAVHMDNVLFED